MTLWAASAAMAAGAGSSPAPRLDAIADEFYAARVEYDPLNYASVNGDPRYDDKLGLPISPAVRRAYFGHLHRLRAQLAAVPVAGLNEKERLNREILSYLIDASLELEPFPEHLLPLSQMDNVPSVLANYASGTGSQPLATPAEYRAYVSRLQQLSAWIDQAIANMRAGIRQGVVQPRAVTAAMIPQFEAMSSPSVEESIFYSPIRRMPASFSGEDSEALRRAYRTVIADRLQPALRRLNDFLKGEYLQASRTSSGLDALPQGAAWYRARIRVSTNLPLAPEAVHELGLREVARIRGEMAGLADRLGFKGPSEAFPKWVLENPEFRPFKSADQVVAAYQAIYAQVSAHLPAFFDVLPKAKLEIRLEPELTRAAASDHYTPLAADGSHPGVFWPVVNDPKEYSSVGMVTLFLHEGVPGHHLHAALLKELALPDFRKYNTENLDTAAYTEGWALYCETLGKEFKFYEQPLAEFGHRNNEMLRAVRLVVDTGIHAQGWSRERAIEYAMHELGYTEAAARNQIERYMATPAQALSYKIGALKILELRRRAQEKLGDRFTYARFHDVIVGDGTLPLSVMERQVDRWIAREQGSQAR